MRMSSRSASAVLPPGLGESGRWSSCGGWVFTATELVKILVTSLPAPLQLATHPFAATIPDHPPEIERLEHRVVHIGSHLQTGKSHR